MRLFIFLILTAALLTGCATGGYQPTYIISHDEELPSNEDAAEVR